MPFTLLVCADICNDKVNLELQFPQRPTLPELQSYVEAAFNSEIQALGVPSPGGPFRIHKIQIYDDICLKWVDLTSPEQMHDYDQVYCFQPQSPWQSDVQKDLPAPRPPTRSVPMPVVQQSVHQPQPQQYYGSGGGYAPPPPHASTYPRYHPPTTPDLGYAPRAQTVSGLQQPVGAAALSGERPNVPLEDRIRISFQEMDEGRKGWLDVAELERGFRTRGIDFSTSTVQELFAKADIQPRDGRLDANEWHIFAKIYPNTVDAVYYRGRDMREEQRLRDSIAATQAELDAGRQKEMELSRQADAQAQHNQGLMRAIQDIEAQLRSAAERRNLLEGQERALIEQEVKLERQKDALRASVHKFKETASAFDRDAATHGSPRRSRAPLTDIPL